MQFVWRRVSAVFSFISIFSCVGLFAGGKPEELRLIWGSRVPVRIYESSPFEERGEEVKGAVDLPAYGIITLRIFHL